MRVTRRDAVAAVGTALSASLAGCVGGLLGGGATSQVQRYADEAREATAQYDGDRRAAIEDGYTRVLGPLIPGQGWHFSNPEYGRRALERGSFDLTEPPILMFDRDGNLGSVEYGGPDPKMPQRPDLFADVDADVAWGVHRAATHVFADGEDAVTPLPERTIDEIMTVDWWRDLGYVDNGITAGDEVEMSFGPWQAESETPETRVVDFVTTHPDLRSVHFWVHAENPQGMFAPAHPDFAQPR